MKQFKLLNNIFGWVAFVIAATTYLITMEPTASFWDCGEFISTAFKLDVGHPPGAPFFMLTGRFFSLFASDPTQVALMINTLSALASAFTILFLFWTITHLARKVVAKTEEEYTLANVIGILGSGMVGALAYTFSDTFWFSAVEGEVYAYSSLFTAVVFWAILKWENVADRPGSDRWLIFIGYLMGLSIGVHLLNLLAIPAIVLVYYFRNYKPSTKGVVLAMSTAVVILGVVLYGIIPGFVEVASWFELFFVNTLGFSFNTGLFIYILLTLAALAWGLHETYNEKNYVRMAISFIVAFTLVGIPFFGSHIVLGLIIVAGMTYFFFAKREKINARWLNTALAMITVILIGYSTYTVIVIRSAANPPMDQNSPDNVFALKYYLNREQYGDRPLFYGSVYNAPVKLRVEGNMCVPEEIKGEAQYAPKPKTSANDKDEYFVTGNKMDYKMDERFDMLFPRMYSSTPSHVEAYKIWGNVKGKSITYDYCGQQKTEVKPTFGENIQFFLDYQVRFMYLRYFMWNFSGRQNDIQGNGEIEHGNWITGFNFIDKYLVGDQTKLPSELAENKGRNTYFMLPLLLGIFGILFLIYNGKEGKHTFWVTTLLFLLTGLAIVIYLNQTPYQPRERDYAYAGSFYAFSIWIGLGVLGIIKAIDKYIPKAVAASVVTILALGVPALMAAENWDDHDRSNRYVARDFGGNYLASLKPNAIVFSNGDNDTFPLWYNQEVEGQRTDVRVCNLSYLQTDWYIDQMKRGAYESAPLPISWEAKDYVTGKNEVMWVEDMIKEPIDMKTAFDFLLSDDPATKMNGESFIPSSKLFLPVDANQVIKSGTLAPERAGEIVPQIDVELKRRITKSEIMILEMLKTNNWKRPVYFAVTVGDDYYLGLNDHFELTGLAYQILPIGAKGAGSGVNTKEMYDNMINKFRYGNIQDPKVYLDENTLRMCRTHRMMFSQLASALYNEGDSVKALKTLDFAAKMIPGNTVRHDYVSTMLAETYYKLGESQKGDAIMEAVAKDCVEYLEWYYTLTVSQRNSVNNRIGHNLAVLNQILRICDQENQKNILDKYLPVYMKYTKNVEL
jgi:MFS family permease